MSAKDQQEERVESVETKLNRLFRCIVEQARQNPEFAEEIGKILQADATSRTRKTQRRTNKTTVNLVERLQKVGPEEFKLEIDQLTNSELDSILLAHEIARKKELRAMNHDDKVNGVLAYADKTLNQGGVFLKDKSEDSSDSVSEESTSTDELT